MPQLGFLPEARTSSEERNTPGARARPARVSTSAELAVLVAAVRGAIDDAERELSRMPFFVRPMARKGFSSRTGLTYDEWREHLGALRAGDSPSTARARWTHLSSCRR